MKWYWKAIQLEEYGELPRSERHRILRLHRNKAYKNWRMWLAIAVSIAIPPLSGQLLWHTKFHLLPGFLILPAIYIWLHVQYLILRPHIRAEIGLCPHCGYDLRESTSRCPECANPFISRDSLPN